TLVGRALDHVAIDHLLWMVLVPLLGAAMISLTLPQTPSSPHRDRQWVRGTTMRKEVVALLLAGFLMLVAHGPLYTFYSLYLQGAGYSKTAVGALWSLGVIAEILVFLAMPYWLARFSARAILLASF